MEKDNRPSRGVEDLRKAITFGLVNEDELLIQRGTLADVLAHAANRARSDAIESEIPPSLRSTVAEAA